MKVPPDPQTEDGNRKKKLYQICLIRQSNDLFALINDDKVFSFFPSTANILFMKFY